MATRIIQALDSGDFDVVPNIEAETAIDVVISDSATCSTKAQARLQFGSDIAADANLSRDASPETIRTTVTLLGRIARLERNLVETDRRRKEVEHEASTDPLTGVANRRAWERELQRLKSSPATASCVAIVDLDRFKEINTQHGHLVGDRVLATFAGAMADELRSTDVVARLGGDEFAILLAGVNREQATTVLERVRHQARQALVSNELPAVTASVGFAMSADVAEADRALRAAKEQGRDRVVAWPRAS